MAGARPLPLLLAVVVPGGVAVAVLGVLFVLHGAGIHAP